MLAQQDVLTRQIERTNHVRDVGEEMAYLLYRVSTEVSEAALNEPGSDLADDIKGFFKEYPGLWEVAFGRDAWEAGEGGDPDV